MLTVELDTGSFALGKRANPKFLSSFTSPFPSGFSGVLCVRLDFLLVSIFKGLALEAGVCSGVGVDSKIVPQGTAVNVVFSFSPPGSVT